MRGKRSARSPASWRGGLIPACAGKTRNTYRPRWLTRAHPRVCGENQPTQRAIAANDGSSPRVRGKRIYGIITALVPRLIPACAGKTSAVMGVFLAMWAHPRVCGENLLAGHTAMALQGSSPRVRGKPQEVRVSDGAFRLIPACAGKTFHRSFYIV